MRTLARSLLVIVLAFSFYAVVLSAFPAPPALAQCAYDPKDPNKPCCDQGYGPDQFDPGCRVPPGSTANDFPWVWVGGLIVLVGVAAGAWWARRKRAAVVSSG